MSSSVEISLNIVGNNKKIGVSTGRSKACH